MAQRQPLSTGQRRQQSMVRSTKTRKTSLEYTQRASGVFLRHVFANYAHLNPFSFVQGLLAKTRTSESY